MSLTWTHLLFMLYRPERLSSTNTRKALYPRLLISNILCRPNCMHTVSYIYLLRIPYLKFWRSQSFSRHSYVRWFLLASPQRSEFEQKVSLFETTANKFYVRKTCSLIISFNIFRSCSRFVSFTKRPQGSLKRCCLILATRNPNSTLNPLSVTMVVPLIQFISFFLRRNVFPCHAHSLCTCSFNHLNMHIGYVTAATFVFRFFHSRSLQKSFERSSSFVTIRTIVVVIDIRLLA